MIVIKWNRTAYKDKHTLRQTVLHNDSKDRVLSAAVTLDVIQLNISQANIRLISIISLAKLENLE